MLYDRRFKLSPSADVRMTSAWGRSRAGAVPRFDHGEPMPVVASPCHRRIKYTHAPTLIRPNKFDGGRGDGAVGCTPKQEQRFLNPMTRGWAAGGKRQQKQFKTF
jgi:hypothetical protein